MGGAIAAGFGGSMSNFTVGAVCFGISLTEVDYATGVGYPNIVYFFTMGLFISVISIGFLAYEDDFLGSVYGFYEDCSVKSP